MANGSSPSEMAAEIVALFERAESKIKTLELIQDEGLFYHPVNQLRYAGFHIARAVKNTEEGDHEEEWKRARRHCQRAIYDASEMALVYCIAEINGFQDDYKKVDITPTVTDYLEIIAQVRAAQSLIESTDHESREDKFEECDSMFNALRPHVDLLNDARPELNKRMNVQRKNVQLAVSGLFIGAIGIIVAVTLA